MVLAVTLLAMTGCGAPARHTETPLVRWLALRPLLVAHRGGDANWPEGSAYAYARAAAWNSSLALEVPVWRTSDGVWVVSEEATTGRVFGIDYRIDATPWHDIAGLRSTRGRRPMARLEHDVLAVYGRNRILFVDDKSGRNMTSLLDLLSAYAGSSRYVVKCYWSSSAVADAAHRRGYRTWGYYYARDMPEFAATQRHFDLLGLDVQAPVADFVRMRATGKPVIAHVLATRSQVTAAEAKGADGLMISGVTEVVPHHPR